MASSIPFEGVSIMSIKNSWHSKFEQIEVLGTGGNATVYRVKAIGTDVEYALKELSNKNKEKKRRFIDEINIMRQIGGVIDGVIPIIDAVAEEYWYTMPIADPILKHLETSKEAIEDIIRGAIQLSETLSKLHAKHISHRDIKPSNIYFYKNRYCFGDFGLVDHPDNSHDFTRSDRGLGAIFTIAPEMKRDPQNADGMKGDVFSLAKTIWMLLTGDERGFDGVYNFLDKNHSLRFMKKFSRVHTVELENLLASSTNNSPELRPNIGSFKQQLEMWLDVFLDVEKSQASEWNFLDKYLFGDNSPESTTWKRTDRIVNVLNIIGTLPAYNHMFFPDGGGLDFGKADFSNEDGCIYVYDSNGFCSVLKPKSLNYEGFGKEHVWNYFLLELHEQSPINDYQSSLNYETLVEDMPAHYVPATYADYGVYDYDSGVPLPEGYKVVQRYLRGKFLIVLKSGPYNRIAATYDGRHSMCSKDEFRQYIDNLILVVEKLVNIGLGKGSILNSNVISRNPFEEKENHLSRRSDEDYKNPKAFLMDQFKNWCFKDLFEKNVSMGNISFYITFKNAGESNWLFEEQLYLCADGHIKFLNDKNLDEAFCVHDRDEALSLKKRCAEFINDQCIDNGFDIPYESYFSIHLRRSGKPMHLFSKEEIEEVMRNADDRNNNMLVIDENGYVKIIQSINHGLLYPVRHEAWNAGNIYVGKYSKLGTLNESYISSLQGWLIYLRTGERVYLDYVRENVDEDELIKSIREYY